MRPEEGENTRRFSDRIEQAVNLLALEANSDYWTAARTAASGASTISTDRPVRHGGARGRSPSSGRRGIAGRSEQGPRLAGPRAPRRLIQISNHRPG